MPHFFVHKYRSHNSGLAIIGECMITIPLMKLLTPEVKYPYPKVGVAEGHDTSDLAPDHGEGLVMRLLRQRP